MEIILMGLELLEQVEGDEFKDRGYLMVFKGLKYDITYKVYTDKIRHRLDDPISLDTLIELYVEIPNFINKQKSKRIL